MRLDRHSQNGTELIRTEPSPSSASSISLQGGRPERGAAVMADVCIEHHYPDALRFLDAHGPTGIAILHDLITHAQLIDGQLVVQASVRQIAERLPILSKDTVHRRLRAMHRANVLRPTSTASRFERPTYLLDLSSTGIRVAMTRP